MEESSKLKILNYCAQPSAVNGITKKELEDNKVVSHGTSITGVDELAIGGYLEEREYGRYVITQKGLEELKKLKKDTYRVEKWQVTNCCKTLTLTIPYKMFTSQSSTVFAKSAADIEGVWLSETNEELLKKIVEETQQHLIDRLKKEGLRGLKGQANILF